MINYSNFLEKVICKNSLIINHIGREKRQIFTENGIYKAYSHKCFVTILDNYNYITQFYIPEKDTSIYKLNELWFSDWFYSKAELRQKQIDSIIYGENTTRY